LLDEYGQYENLPETIKAPVLEITHHRLDSINQKKYRFLDHLPVYSVFSFVELDLKDQLSKKILDFYKTDLQEREKFRLAQKQKEQELEKLNPQKYFFMSLIIPKAKN